jgi:hypothetical protein
MFTNFEVIEKACGQDERQLLYLKKTGKDRFAVVIYDPAAQGAKWHAGGLEGENMEDVVNWVDRDMADACFRKRRTT